jgi:hypothetical protein
MTEAAKAASPIPEAPDIYDSKHIPSEDDGVDANSAAPPEESEENSTVLHVDVERGRDPDAQTCNAGDLQASDEDSGNDEGKACISSLCAL